MWVGRVDTRLPWGNHSDSEGCTLRTTPKRSRRLATISAVGAVLVLLPGIAVAVNGFSDVPAGYVHKPGIDYVASTGITAGCEDGSKYCPNDDLTRGQMATFMFRASGKAPGIAPSVNAATVGGQSASDIAAMAVDATGFVPINAAMNFGEDVLLIDNGHLSVRASCEVDGPSDVVEVYVTSSAAGWYDTYSGSTPNGAGDEIVMFEISDTNGSPYFEKDIDDGAAISAAGAYIGVQGETLALGLNVLGNDCVVAGVAFVQDVAL